MGSDREDDSAIWDRARDGDGAAFAALFRTHHDRVYRRACALMQDAHDAEDVTAVTFFELWRRRRSVRLVDASVLPWLLVTTMNVARNHRRGAGRYRRVLAAVPREEPADAEQLAVTSMETELLGIRLTDALARVSPTDAALLALTVLDDLSIVDAATVLGITPGAARMRLHRARLRLQHHLANDRPTRTRTSPEGEHA